jgi:YidC/Oxa1 family membrane protein insertase
MDNQRLFLFFGLALVLMLLWQAWEQENARPPDSTTATCHMATATGCPPGPCVATEAVPAPKATEGLSRGSRIEVRTYRHVRRCH